MPFAIVERPSVFLARRVGVAAPEETAAMMERLRLTMAEASSPCVVVYDAGHDPSGRPDARSRQVFATWFGENEALMKRRCLGIDCSFPTALSRGILTAVLWLKSPAVPTHVHGNCADAVRAAVARAGSTADVKALLRALDEAAVKLGGSPATGGDHAR